MFPSILLRILFLSVLRFIPCSIPYSVPCSIPYTVPCSIPYSVPCSIPYTVPCSIPYTVPCSIPYSIPFRVPFHVPLRFLVTTVFGILKCFTFWSGLWLFLDFSVYLFQMIITSVLIFFIQQLHFMEYVIWHSYQHHYLLCGIYPRLYQERLFWFMCNQSSDHRMLKYFYCRSSKKVHQTTVFYWP